jgi:hypothetical protein
MKLEPGQTVIVTITNGNGKQSDKHAVFLQEQDGGKLRLKVDMDDYMGGHLWTSVDPSTVKEVCKDVPKVDKKVLFE